MNRELTKEEVEKLRKGISLWCCLPESQAFWERADSTVGSMEDEAMIIKDPAGNRHEANLTTAHAQNSYGQPVLVIDGDAYGPGDIQGWEIVEASDEEWDAFRQAGYMG